jgi:glycosyltransferase involved in cell wall biosynthesis
MTVIGYVMQKYPSLTLTFVYREVFALRAAGLQINTFSIWKPRLDELSPEARALVDETFYLLPLNLPRFTAAHLRYGLKRPRRYLGALAACLRGKGVAWGRRLRALGHFLLAVYLADEVERRRIQHLHAHFARNAATLALVVARLTRVTFSFTAHANDLFVSPTLLSAKVKAARFVVAISDYNREVLQQLAPGLETLSKIHVVHCGLDLRRFSRDGWAPDQRDQPPLILGVGRLVEKKGFEHLIRACKLLAHRGYAFRCMIIGQGPEAVRLKHQIEAEGLTATVQLVGAVVQEKLMHYFAQARIVTLPCVVARDGDQDGIPVTLMEAMALEIPVVSTPVSGIPELIEHEKTGLLVPAGDASALAGALARLLDDDDLCAELGRAGRAKVAAEFDIHANAQVLARLFRTELDHRLILPAPTHASFAGAAAESLPIESQTDDQFA